MFHVHEMFGCQCERCQRWRQYRLHSDARFDAQIERHVRERVNAPKPLPPVADEWGSLVANVRASLQFIASAIRSMTTVRLN